MSNAKLGVDCCGDRYEVSTQHQCMCCGVCFCTSCYRVHCQEKHEQRFGRARSEVTTHCCKLGCGKPLGDLRLPFCDEHMKDKELVQSWLEL